MPKKIDAFRASDGKVFEKEIDAEIHEAGLELNKASDEFKRLISKHSERHAHELSFDKLIDDSSSPIIIGAWANKRNAYDILLSKKSSNEKKTKLPL